MPKQYKHVGMTGIIFTTIFEDSNGSLLEWICNSCSHRSWYSKNELEKYFIKYTPPFKIEVWKIVYKSCRDGKIRLKVDDFSSRELAQESWKKWGLEESNPILDIIPVRWEQPNG